jgi:hypothetical protein
MPSKAPFDKENQGLRLEVHTCSSRWTMTHQRYAATTPWCRATMKPFNALEDFKSTPSASAEARLHAKVKHLHCRSSGCAPPRTACGNELGSRQQGRFTDAPWPEVTDLSAPQQDEIELMLQAGMASCAARRRCPLVPKEQSRLRQAISALFGSGRRARQESHR